MADPRIRQAMADAARWLTPDEMTAEARADAGAEAVQLVDALLRACLRAGITSTPRDRFGRLILDLETELRIEAEALRAWADTPGADETPALMAAE